MSVPTDLSLMDFLFEREDPILGLTEKDIIGSNDQKDCDSMAVSYFYLYCVLEITYNVI